MIKIRSKLPNVGTNIFTHMSLLAKQFDAVNLSQGFPDYPVSERLRSIVEEKVRTASYQYTPMIGLPELREKLAEKMYEWQGVRVNPEREVTIHASATHGLAIAIEAFVRDGDHVIVFEPCYDCYKPMIEANGGIVRPVPLVGGRIDWSVFEQVYSEEVAAIIVNTPHNPSGRVIDEADLESLGRRIKVDNTVVISDEVYEHLTFDGIKHRSLLSFPDLVDRTIAVYSFGKTYHATGFRIGYSLAAAELAKEIRKFHQYQAFCLSAFTQEVFLAMLNFPEEYLGLPDFFQPKRDKLRQGLLNSKFNPHPCDGTYFMTAEYSRISGLSDQIFCEELVRHHKLALIPISPFFSDSQRHFIVRFCFAKTDETLDRGLEIISRLDSVE